jgi:hypothetical protein
MGMSSSVRLAPIALAAIALSLACVQGARAPQVPPRGTLAIGEAVGPGGRPEGPFAVVFGGPSGETVDPSEVTLVFNRPMRPLDLAGDEARAPATITPPVRGRWQWVGTSGLVFVPETRLPRATPFTVTVPADTRALDGTLLGTPYRLEFTTARPKLVRVDPSGGDDLEPSATFTLRFNQPVSNPEISKAATLSVGGKPVAFDVRRPDPQNEMLAEIAPRARLPLDAAITLRIGEALRGTEGPLPSGEAQAYEFRTYGPLRLGEVRCDKSTPHGFCAPDGGFSIELTNRVTLGALKRAVRTEPAVKIRWPTWLDDDDLTGSIDVAGRFEPSKTFRVRVAAGLKDEHGQALGTDWSADVRFDDYWPSAEIGIEGTILEPSARREIPVASLNVSEIDLAVAPLSEAAILALEADKNSPGRPPTLAEIARQPGGKQSRLTPRGEPNKSVVTPVRPEEVLGGKDKRGPLAVGIAYTDRPGTRQARRTERTVVAQVTDLAITAKLSPHGSLVWVTRLSEPLPVEGALVRIQRPGEAQAPVFRTDKNGFAPIPESAFTPTPNAQDRAVIFVRAGDDFAYARADDTLSGWRFNAPFEFGEDRPFGMVFTERGIYRPGDVVHVKGIFRADARIGTRTPAGAATKLEVEGPDGETITSVTHALSPFGTLSADVKIPETGKLGSYSIQATVGESARGWADVSASFEVAEYRPAEFKVSVESDRPSYVRGDKARWVARGDYLYGAPMSGADVRLSVTRGETYFVPPHTEGFSTDDDVFTADLPDASPREDEVETRRTKLDARGSAEIDATLSMPGQRGPEEVTCEAEVTDISRQSIAGSTTAIVHPAEFYVAVKAGKDMFVPAKEAVKPEILAVDPKGSRISGVSVRVDLVERKWMVARQQTGGAALHSVSTAVDRVTGSCTVTTGASPASCSLTPPGAGYYLLHATATDRRKNTAKSAVSLYVLGEGTTGWRDSDRLAIELVPDRHSYEPGQVAKVLVKSPFTSAEALVTVERTGIYSQRRVTLSGPMPTVEVPITDDLRPNAFVSVLLVRGRTKAAPASPKAPDVGAPAFRLGYAALPINPESRRLAVTLKPSKTDARPSESIDVDVDVRDRSGKPARAEVTLYAVDEGVLSLIGYKTPDPIKVFGAPRPLRVATLEARAALARVHNPFADLGLDKGLDGGGGGIEPGVRRDFRQSAYYHPALVTDTSGHVRASFKLPDSLTTYRVMAVVAAEDDRFGYAEDRVTASRPLMARPALPRFVRAGDKLDAGIIVTSKGLAAEPSGRRPASPSPAAPIAVDVELTAEGLTVSGPTKRTVNLEPGGSTEVRFAMAAPTVGKARLLFRIKAGKEQDAVEVTRDVLAPMLPEAVALYGDTTGEAAEKLGDMSAIRPDVGGLDVSLSSTALVGLGGGVEQLIEYPYGCTEQHVSRLVPLLPLRDLARDYKIALPADLNAVIHKTLREILNNQRSDGGFGMWAESTQPNLWVTTYALWGLNEAKRHGANVPPAAITNAAAYVRRELSAMERDEIHRATAPFILDVLADSGAPDPGRVTRLYEERTKLPLFSQALLAHAMVIGKSDRGSIDRLIAELEGHLRLDGPVARAAASTGNQYAVLMDSETRTTALVLRALLAARPNHPLASRLAMGLLADRRGGTWRSTQETAWSLLALDQYRLAQEKTTPDFTARVFLGATEIFSAPFRNRDTTQAQTRLPASTLASAGGSLLSFAVDGRGKLFYEARIKYARKEMPTQPLERGFFVRKTLRPVTAEGLAQALQTTPDRGTSSFTGADLVLAELVVVTPSPRDYVVVDDPLPAGFEAVDARLATTARPAGELDEDEDEREIDEDEIATGRAFLPSSFIREIRDDRVVFFVDHMAAGMYRYRYLARATTMGTFVLPPARAEEMYAPEVFGRTGADVIVVTPKK